MTGEAHDQDFFLRVIDRSYPLDYIFSIKQKPNGGYEVFQGSAKVSERVSLAISRFYAGMFILSAAGGSFATGPVEFFRDSFAAGEVTVLAGTIVTTEDGRDFVTTENAVFGATDLVSTPSAVNVISVAMGYEYNVPGQVITAGSETLPGEINIIKRIVATVSVSDTTPVLDTSMQVRQIVETTGGAAACLDALGEDLLIPRLPLESDVAYKARIREVPDTVSPDAIARGVNKLLAPFGASACLREVGTDLLPGMFYDAGSSTDSPQHPERNFAFDFDFITRPNDRFKLLLNFAEMRGFFLVGVPPIVVSDFGAFYDGTTVDAFPLINPFDVNLPGSVPDGFTTLAGSVYKSISDLVSVKKAFGVGFDVYIEDLGCF